jgi:NADH-quinone oxidoreductase subunit H
LIAYEIPLGLGILGVVLAAGSLRLETVISAQASTGLWNVLLQPLGFSVFLIAAFAEAARLPFDLPECEQELIGGYHTEYSGMKLLLFLIAEFLHMVIAAFLIVILFLGGWHFWGLSDALEPIGWPMNLAWKVMLPLGLVNLVAVAAVLEYEHAAGEPTPGGTGLAIAIGWGIAVVAWIVAAWLAPLHTDNRPRIDALAPPAFEPAELLARERQITTT